MTVESSNWLDSEDDEEPIELLDISSAFVTDTDWTTETILSQMRRGNIHLNPRFQRRDAWDKKRKSRFIESLILGLPIPQLVFAEDKRRKGAFIVLDGKQRLLTLSQFAKNSSLEDISSDQIKQLTLTGLEARPDLQKMSLRDFESKLDLSDELNSFLNQTIRTVVVRNWPDEAFLNMVFLRLNTGSVSLSPQELRQALHPGPFTDFLDDFASESAPLQNALNIDGPDFRMRDVEILLRFFAVKLYLSDYRGSLKNSLDDASDSLNKSWGEREYEIRELAESFDSAVDATLEIFGDNAFRRWNPEKRAYEKPFNRAVFDSMTYYFSEGEIRSKALERSGEVKDLFANLSNNEPSFVESLQTSTKTIEALHKRLSLWGDALGDALGLDIKVPVLTADRKILP